jgi:hypothetical protein
VSPSGTADCEGSGGREDFTSSAGREGSTGPAYPVPGFTPETELERAVSEDPVLREGLAWGRPRRGHPEGSVGAHVADLLETIERWGETGKRREELRFLALVHDALKNRVSNLRPKTGENHHAMRARRFAERYVDDERLLATIEQHDRPYSLWRRLRRRGRIDEHAFSEMLDRIPDIDLFLRFVELDGSTDGKNHEPIRWLKQELGRHGVFEKSNAERPVRDRPPCAEDGSTEG